MSTVERSYYVVTCKPEYFRLMGQDPERSRMVVAIPQGGFGQDVVDEEEQVKERFLEYLFGASGVDLPRSVEVFDQYFELEPASEFIDLS